MSKIPTKIAFNDVSKLKTLYFQPSSFYQIIFIYQVDILSLNRIIMFLIRLCCGQKDPQKKDEQAREIIPKANLPKKQTPSIKPKSQINLASNLDLVPQANQSSCLLQNNTNRSDNYQGQKTNNLPNGNGTMLYANGDFYRGQWSNGFKEGKGLQIYNSLKYEYEGQWKNDKYEGTGKIILQNASFYLGEFKNGVKHGKGQFFDCEKKKQFNELYDMGVLMQQKQVVMSHSHEQEYPTLNFDKQRFNTHDLMNYQRQNPSIKQLDISFLLKYHHLCKLKNIQFIHRNVKEWSMKEVLDFLETIGINDYKQAFYKNKIKGKHLITLKESELKDDLKMRLGDRKRLITILKYFTRQKDYENQIGIQRHQIKQNIVNQKYRSIKTQIYKQSIMEQQMESDRESKVFLNDEVDAQEEEKMEQKYKSAEYKYVSAAEPINAQDNCQQRYASIQKRMEALSERTDEHHSSSKRDITRKNSKDIQQFNYFYGHGHQTHHKINTDQQSLSQIQRYSQREPPQPQILPNSLGTSQTNSSQQVMNLRLQRNPTFQKSNSKMPNSQIRQLYDFLKQHRSLSFIIKQKDIEEIELIGQGGFGKVYRGKYVGQQIAIKDFIKTGKHQHQLDFMKELQIISDLKHPNIVLYMGICITANKYTLITEYLQNGSLFDQLHKKKKKFTEIEKRSIAYDIVKGMVYLHNMKKILHRDLKSSNVLIGQNWQVKLCDFGLSGQKKSSLKKNKNRIGTYQWMAPQVMRNQDQIDQYADVYSFGVIIWQLLSEKIPFQGLSEQQMIGLVGYDSEHSFDDPQGSAFLKSIMWKCLNRDPKQRPTFIQIQCNFEQGNLMLKQKSNSGQNLI